MHAFQFEKCEIRKTANFHSNLLVSWELVTESYQAFHAEMCTFRNTFARHGNFLILCVWTRFGWSTWRQHHPPTPWMLYHYTFFEDVNHSDKNRPGHSFLF